MVKRKCVVRLICSDSKISIQLLIRVLNVVHDLSALMVVYRCIPVIFVGVRVVMSGWMLHTMVQSEFVVSKIWFEQRSDLAMSCGCM